MLTYFLYIAFLAEIAAFIDKRHKIKHKIPMIYKEIIGNHVIPIYATIKTPPKNNILHIIVKTESNIFYPPSFLTKGTYYSRGLLKWH